MNSAGQRHKETEVVYQKKSDNRPYGTTAPRERKTEEQGGGLLDRLRSRKVLMPAVIVAAILVVIVIVLVVRAWTGDESLRNQAAGIGQSNGSAPVTVTLPSGMGMLSEQAGGGGIANAIESATFVSTANVLTYGGSSDASFTGLTQSAAMGLNVKDGTLYYVDGVTYNATNGLYGTAIKKVENAAQAAAEGSWDAQDVYAPNNQKITNCILSGDYLYCTVQSSSAATIRRISLGDGSVKDLARKDCIRSWLFIEGTTLYLASTSDSSWCLDGYDLSAAGGTLRQSLSGQGKLTGACLSGSNFYYAVEEQGAIGSMKCKTLQGEFTEFTSAKEPVQIIANDTCVVTLSQDGSLYYSQEGTGFSHDISKAIKEGLGDVDASRVTMAFCGEWLYIADGQGGLCRYSIAKDKLAVCSVEQGN